MELVRRHFDFDDFLDYVAPGFIVAIIVIALGFGFGSLGWWVYWEDANNENKLYAALRGEEWVGEENLKNAEILRGINRGQYPEGEELLELFSKENAWFAIAADHLENVELLLDDSPGAFEFGVGASEFDVHIEPWSRFFILTGFAGFLFLAAAMSVCFAGNTLYMRTPILLYPWNKVWSYPFLMLLFPFVAISQPILLIHYSVWRLRGAQERRSKVESTQRERADIERDRRKAEAQAERVNRDRVCNKARWIRIYEQRLPEMRREIEGRIQSHRSRLGELGLQIEQAQRGLSEERANLGNLEKADWLNRDGGLEFDRLLQIAGVRACEVDEEEIRVYTDTIFIRYMMIKYEIGDFLIRIGIGSSAYLLEIVNLCNTANYERRHHPYGYSDDTDRFCFGNLQEHINALLGKKDYVPLIVVILRALQSSEGDAPSRVTHWKRA
jgi:hypothetical protein